MRWLYGVTGCGLSLVLPGLGISLAVRAFRSIATPITNVMAAADALADGDLSVRVPEAGSPDFRQLAHSFNRMADELERADQQRRTLTADVAHELRTPLHIIQGNLEGILDGVYEADSVHVNATLDEAKQLTRLVEDLQVLSLAEGGALPLSMQQVALAEVLEDVRTSFSGAAEAAQVELIVRMECEQSTAVYADPGRLNQILTNLVSNALRYTSAGGQITLNSECNEDRICISVIDTGEGIAPEDLPFVFERFWRADRARLRHDKSGGGLGLAIAKKLVEAQGGEISVESVLGQGSKFSLSLLMDDEGL